MISNFQSGPRKHASGLSNGCSTVLEGRKSTKFTAWIASFGGKCVLCVCNIVKKFFRNTLCYKFQACLQRYRKTRKMCMKLSKSRPN